MYSVQNCEMKRKEVAQKEISFSMRRSALKAPALYVPILYTFETAESSHEVRDPAQQGYIQFI